MVKDKMLDVEEEKMAKTNDDGLSYEENMMVMMMPITVVMMVDG